MPRSFDKDPDAILDYEFDWSKELRDGDTLAEATVTASAGLTVATDPPVTWTTTAVTYWLSGGVVGQSYPVTCHIVTTAGREDDRTVTVTVRER